MGSLMSYAHKTLVFLVSLVCGLAAVSFAAPHVAAADVNISLFGSRAEGWGFTNTSITSPGPALTVHVGDNVTLNLTANDTFAHRWFIDYNGNNVSSGTEPTSPIFGTAVLWNFTVSNVTGTYRYRSDRTAGAGDDLSTMWGNITILAAEGPGLFGGDNTVLVIVGSIVIVVAVLVFATYFWRRMKTPPPPPEKE
ncbi:MAG TPA: hypothetical protein VEM77_01560 [Thermoplasmata archaeon]|nr:hypothetical protein [Thermoplasmata archaeon]